MKFINLHCHRLAQDKTEFRIYNRYTHEEKPLGFYSSGIHPWRIDNWETQLEMLHQIARDENCIAIGECGVDRAIDTPIELQQTIFEQQIALAESVQKPLIIHCVRAFDLLLSLKKKHKITVPIISHGYKSKPEQLKQLTNAGIKVSFGKALLNSSTALREGLNQLSLRDFFLETDNSPDIHIEQVYYKASELTNYSVDELKTALYQNFIDTFPHARF